MTLARDDLSTYNGSFSATPRGPALDGWTEGALASHGLGAANSHWVVEPIGFPGGRGAAGFGWFRLPNCKQLNKYVNGQWCDSVFYAPKDPAWTRVEPCFDDSGALPSDLCNQQIWSTYCLSPAALVDPQVLSFNEDTGAWFTDPWDIPNGHRVPAMSQIEFPTLKTHMLEHPWLQNTREACNPGFSSTGAGGCEPYYFNHGWDSSPATLAYDGSVRLMDVQEALDADRRFRAQNGGEIGLWNNQTPFGGDYAPNGNGGYYSDFSYDWTATSYHILTTEGARGRDTMGM